MSHRPQQAPSEHAHRIKLLGLLGFVPGKSTSTDAPYNGLMGWHFGMPNGKLPSGATPMAIPPKRIFEWIKFYIKESDRVAILKQMGFADGKLHGHDAVRMG
jgi:hypothetical protein